MARIQWQRFEWTSGADAYTFEVTDSGLFGRLESAGGRTVTLPMVAWEGMLDSVTLARKSRSQGDRHQPDRAGARWSDPEVIRLERAFKSGRSIAELARTHARSVDAVETQLEKLGLWNSFERRAMSEAPPYPDHLHLDEGAMRGDGGARDAPPGDSGFEPGGRAPTFSPTSAIDSARGQGR